MAHLPSRILLMVITMWCLLQASQKVRELTIDNIIKEESPLIFIQTACRDLIKIILVPIPTERATLAQIRQHPWVNEGFAGPPPCLVSEFPPVVNINEEILAQVCFPFLIKFILDTLTYSIISYSKSDLRDRVM